MADLDTITKRRCAAGNSPIPDGNIDTYYDRRQMAYNYRNFPLLVALDGELTPTGVLLGDPSAALSGNITPSGNVLTWQDKSVGGSITPAGSVAGVIIHVQAVSGELEFVGVLAGGNPYWVEIHTYMNWKGVWDANTEYALWDVVLYADGNNIHAFVSKTSHNTGNLPTDQAYWDRLFQEKWKA